MKWIILSSCLALAGCTSGAIPITLSGYGATATVVIPQQQPKVVPVVAMPTVAQPTLLVPNAPASSTAIALGAKGADVTVPVIQSPVVFPTLAVPSK